LRQVQSGEGGFAALVRALHDNRSLWTTLAADVAVETNELSKPLRAQIFYLAQFTTEHSRRVIAGDATVDILIDINTAVMRGLRGEGEGA
jgi:flagellar protein FlaF